MLKYQCVESDPRYKDRLLDGPAIDAAGRKWVVNPEAENLAYLIDGYYADQLTGSLLDEIQRDLQVKFIYASDGKPVTPEFLRDVHVKEFSVLDDVQLILGSDVGGGTLNPAGVIAQKHPRGTLMIHDEFYGELGVDRFSRGLYEVLNRPHFERAPVPELGRGLDLITDPAGIMRDEVFETAIHDHLIDRGWHVIEAWTNATKFRIEAVRNMLSQLADLGVPRLIIHPRCKGLIKTLSGKWEYRRLKVSGEAKYTDDPVKSHPWSDLGDSLGYLCMETGEGQRFRKQNAQEAAQKAKTEFEVYGTRPAQAGANVDFDPLS